MLRWFGFGVLGVVEDEVIELWERVCGVMDWFVLCYFVFLGGYLWEVCLFELVGDNCGLLIYCSVFWVFLGIFIYFDFCFDFFILDDGVFVELVFYYLLVGCFFEFCLFIVLLMFILRIGDNDGM